jgi:3-methyl-2-oxobutanoate hydroxymethyltransferase
MMKNKQKFSLLNYPGLKKAKPITWITAYDYPLANVAEKAGIDMILVGDSGGMVQHGLEDTTPVTMEMSINMCKAVRRGASNTFLVGDMPFGSYEISDHEAVKNAVSFVKHGRVDSVKLEGGSRVSSRVKAITRAGIIVFGHIGLTPQSANSFGGYKVQGKDIKNFEKLIEDAVELEASGASAILLEAIPQACSQMIKKYVDIPILGIGAGGGIDGQLLIVHDVLGLYPNFVPRFAKNYFNIVIQDMIDRSKNKSFKKKQFTSLDIFQKAIELYVKETKNKTFPSDEYIYPIHEQELESIKTSKYWKE